MGGSVAYEPLEQRQFHLRNFAQHLFSSNALWISLAAGMLLVVAAVLTPNEISSVFATTAAAADDAEERLIPFLPGLTKAAEMAEHNNIYQMNVDEIKNVSWIPYHVARDMCRSKYFESVAPSDDRIMYEISVGNCGSTWQLLMIGTVVRLHGWRLPIIHIERKVIENWPGLKNLQYTESATSSWGKGDSFGRLFKIQHLQQELFNRSSLIFNAFKLSERTSEMNTFAHGTCPCCFVMKDLLGDKDAETAMIYMHSFAMGLDLTTENLRFVRLKLAEWIKSHYCFPGSVHTSACAALSEFPELQKEDFPFEDYNDDVIEDEK